MKVVYVAGSYRAATVHGVLENIRKAEALAIQVWKTGTVALCPHMNSAFFDGLVPDKAFLDGTIELLDRCDGMVLVGGWEKSEGTLAEVRYAKKNGIPIFYSVGALERYKNFKTWEQAEHSFCDVCTEDFVGFIYCPKCGKELLPF